MEKENDGKLKGASARAGRSPRLIPVEELVAATPKAALEKYTAAYDLRAFAKIFGDSDMMRTAQSFFENDLNVSRTAETLYMHRNTLMYRLNKIKKITGLDIKNFDAAVTFKILTVIYGLK